MAGSIDLLTTDLNSRDTLSTSQNSNMLKRTKDQNTKAEVIIYRVDAVGG